MRFYTFDRVTKQLTGSGDAALDPLEKKINKVDRYLLPADATFLAPPEIPDGKRAVFNGSQWEIADIVTEVKPEQDAVKQVEIEERRLIVETAKADLAKLRTEAEGKALTMAYLDKRLTAIEKILGV